MYKPDPTPDTLEEALWFPENFNWGPSQTLERPTQGGGTAVWSSLQNCYVFKETPDWWPECKPGDPVPPEWGLL